MFKLVFGIVVCTLLSLIGFWLWLFNDSAQSSAAATGGILSAIFAVVFLRMFVSKKRDARQQSVNAKFAMMLAEHTQLRNGNSHSSATEAGPVEVLPAAWFSEPGASNAWDSWFYRSIHVLRCGTMFKLALGIVVCTLLSLMGFWLWLVLSDPAQSSTAVTGGVMSVILAVVFLRKFVRKKKDLKPLTVNAKSAMTLAEHAQLRKDKSHASATEAGPVEVLPAAWFSEASANKAPDSWFYRNIHVFMFLSFLAVGLKLQFSLLFMMGGYIWISLLVIFPCWVMLVSLAMMPFAYNSERSFRIFDLILLTTSAALILPFFASQNIVLFRSLTRGYCTTNV